MVAETEQHYAYDAWNRMTGVYADDAQDPGNPGTRIMTYTYDGLNRLAYSHDNFYYNYYYNEQWQTLEVRKNNPTDGNPERQCATVSQQVREVSSARPGVRKWYGVPRLPLSPDYHDMKHERMETRSASGCHRRTGCRRRHPQDVPVPGGNGPALRVARTWDSTWGGPRPPLQPTLTPKPPPWHRRPDDRPARTRLRSLAAFPLLNPAGSGYHGTSQGPTHGNVRGQTASLPQLRYDSRLGCRFWYHRRPGPEGRPACRLPRWHRPLVGNAPCLRPSARSPKETK